MKFLRENYKYPESNTKTHNWENKELWSHQNETASRVQNGEAECEIFQKSYNETTRSSLLNKLKTHILLNVHSFHIHDPGLISGTTWQPEIIDCNY